MEWDVTYVNRVSIDKDVRCGLWYEVDQPKTPFYEDKGNDLVNNKILNRFEVFSLVFLIELM